MARTAARPRPTRSEHLQPWFSSCTACGRRLWADYKNRRIIATLAGLLRLTLDIRRCHNAGCPRFRKPYRPEAEGCYALLQHQFGLDVIALVGNLRYGKHRSVPEIHQALRRRGLDIAPRTVSNLLDRYDELLAVPLTDGRRLRGLLAGQGRVILALHGLQPDVGHEVLWVLRDCLSGEMLLAQSLLSARQQDLAELIGRVRDGLAVPIVGVISDGQHFIRKAVAQALPGVPHQLCHFHYLREAARPLYEADRGRSEELRRQLETRRQRRVQRRRFRRDPQAYLQALERQLLKSTLPS